MSSETRTCEHCEAQFVIEPDDFAFYEKLKIPAPQACPECRFERRLLFRNERTFYRRKCDLCKKDIIAVYPVGVPFPVYCLKCWWGDGWDPGSYARDFDFARPFFEQYKELLNTVPALAIVNDEGISSVNCEYTYDWFYSKNCYMNVAGWHAENVFYSYHIEHNKDIMDSAHMRESELTYECMQSRNISRSLFCTYCSDCTNCFLGFDLRGCSDCVMCIGLRNKKFCIKNVQYSEAEYKKKISELKLESYRSIQELKKEFREFALTFPHKYAYMLKSVDSTGDFIVNCKNAKYSFMAIDGHNLKFMFGADSGKDSYDCTMTGKSELCNDCVVADEAYGNIYSVFCFKSNQVAYSQYCPSAEWCFGCAGMKKGSYAILNKKYSKEEYENLYGRIVEHMKKTGEWGKFFPHSVSPFAYNETAAQELFPLTKKEAEGKGYRWLEPEAKNYDVTMRPEDLPDSVGEASDAILNAIIGCAHEGRCTHKCTTAFRVVSGELTLYKKLNIPIPHLCPNCRHGERVERRNPIRLWHRPCMCDRQHSHHDIRGKCPNEFETSYASSRPEIVYCEQCYQAEVV